MRGSVPMDDCCDVTATTTFDDEGLTIDKNLETNTYTNDGLGVEMQTICDYLAKPVLISSGNWITASTPNTTLAIISPESLVDLDSPAFNIWLDKLKGYNLFRGTFVIRVVINAMPFQAGSLLGHYLPMVDAMATLNGASYESMHNAGLAAKTQQPNFILKADMSSATMEIPYISPTGWWPLKAVYSTNSIRRYGWGDFRLTVLSTLRTGASQSTSIPYSIYGYWKDVEMAAPLLPHMKGGSSKVPAKKLHKRSIVSSVSKEMENTSGSISNVLSKVSVASGMLSAVPMLAPVMGPVSWASELAAGVANVFGWSKPLNREAPNIVSTQYTRYGATSDGVSTAYPTALRSDNLIEITDRFTPRVEDEMSFGFLKTISCLIETNEWTTTDVPDTVIASFDLSPNSLCAKGQATSGSYTVNYSVGPPAFYLSRGFSLWRGSFKMKLIILKTQFHTGRLQITWIPSRIYNGTPTVSEPSSYLLREIVDIRETTEIELVLPYLMEYNYLKTDEISGRLLITVVNSLRATDTVSNTVDVLAFFSGGDDFELAVPIFMDGKSGLSTQAFSPQMLQEPAEEKEHAVSSVIGNVSTYPTVHARESVGEVFTSVRQLTSRVSMMCQNAVAHTNGVVVNPWFIDVNTVNSLAPGIIGPGNGADAYSYVAKMYAFYRGGMEVHLLPAISSNATQVNSPTVAQLVEGTYSSMITTGFPGVNYTANNSSVTANATSSFGGIVVAQKNTCMTSFSLPYYCATPASLAVPHKSDNWLADKTQPFSFLSVTLGTGPAQFYRIARSTRDDFQFMFFVGCPPVYDDIVT